MDTQLNTGEPLGTRPLREDPTMNSTARTVLIIILVLLVLGMLPVWPYSANFGIYPVGGLGLVLLIVIILLLMGKL